jgi:hypothetical protein
MPIESGALTEMESRRKEECWPILFPRSLDHIPDIPLSVDQRNGDAGRAYAGQMVQDGQERSAAGKAQVSRRPNQR